MAEGTGGRGVPHLDDATMLKLCDMLLHRVPGRTGVLPVGGGTRVQSFRGEARHDAQRGNLAHRRRGTLAD